MTLNPNQFSNQLQMFMTGKELKNYINTPRYTRSEFSEDVEHSNFWSRKLQEAKVTPQPGQYNVEVDGRMHWRIPHGSGIYDSIKDHGYLPEGEAIELRHTSDGKVQQRDGAHRIASAAAIEDEGGDPTYFPVEHTLTDILWGERKSTKNGTIK